MNTKLILSLLSALAALPAAAAVRIWDGGDATANMTAALNWNGNTSINAGDVLVFPSGPAVADKTVNNNFAPNTVFSELQFTDGGYTLNGTILGVSDLFVGLHNNGTTVVNASVALLDTINFGGYGAGGFSMGAGSQIFLNGFALNTYGHVTFGGALAGTGNINLWNAAAVSITGAKTFTADVNIRENSTLSIDHAGGLGAGAGTTSIIDGTLEISSAAPLNVTESIRMTNVDPAASRILSLGGAHTLSGPIELAGDHFKRFEVQGTGLTLSGAISGPESFGAMRKLGPGRLTLSGSASNTFGIQIFSAYEGEVLLNKSGGATAISSPFILIGSNAGPDDSAIVRLGASHQIADTTQVDVSSDGWFDLAGRQETIRHLHFNGEGRVTTNGGTLRLDGDVTAFSAAQTGGMATISGAVMLGAANSVWNVFGGNSEIQLRVNGPITSAVPGGTLTKTGAGWLHLLGNHTLSAVECLDGSLTLEGQSPGMDVNFSTNYLSARGSVRELRATGGALTIAGSSFNGSLTCTSLSLLNGTSFYMEADRSTPVPGVTHDIVEVDGPVDIGVCYFSVDLNPGNLPALPPGTEIIVIRKNSAGPVTGTFHNLPEGALISEATGDFLLSYQGGDGNDVTLTAIIPPTGVSRLWDGGSPVDSNWMTAANWNPNGVPQPGDDLIFPTSAARKNNSNNFPGGTTFHSITVHGTGYGISGSDIVLNEKLEFTSASGNHVWAAPLTLALDVTVSITGNAFVQCGTPLNTNGKTLTLHNAGGGTGDLYFSGAISGSGEVRKTGPGRITFYDHPHTYTGHTTVAEGTLALSYQATLGATGPDSSTTIMAQGTLELRNNEDAIACNESIVLAGHGSRSIVDNGGTFAAQLNGPLSINEGGVIETQGDMLSLNGPVSGTGNLSKHGPGMLTIGGVLANPFSGSLLVYEGNLRLQKAFTNALHCTVTAGLTGLPATVTLAGANQLADDVTVRLWPSGTFDLATHTDTIATLQMRGGLLTGAPASLLTLATLTVLEDATDTGVIAAPIAHTAGGNGVFQIANGPATPDLRIESIVSGTTFEKHGAGRMDFMTNIPQTGLDLLDIKQGSALIFANCRYTDIALNGGLLGGNGTVGNIDSLTGGVISPGTSPGALGGYKATWNAATTLRMELNGLSPGGEYDQYFANGTPDLGGAKLQLSAGFDPAPGAEFMIIRNVSGEPVTGTFGGIPQHGYVSAPGAKIFQINYTGGDGDDVMLTRVEKDAPTVVDYFMKPGQNPGDDSEAHFVFQGVPGLTYLLEVSTDLDIWTELKSASADLITGQIIMDLAEPAGTPRKLYRLRLP